MRSVVFRRVSFVIWFISFAICMLSGNEPPLILAMFLMFIVLGVALHYVTRKEDEQ